ncbi:hypothetical protein SP15_247 [Bacillus phage SP-15]|uniref:Uncharacterized protein n=1 Tax=Bacillus phage SP-15 TaxID=1792032 RepID=A0A127AWT4_9CAUD|nr:hypothetical protein SP15_247 [Bacillus phage SP-15]AMM45052.1 hypothetical protein SP15_247 [Bacillus phage SP-15]
MILNTEAKVTCPHCRTTQSIDFRGTSGGFIMMHCQQSDCDEFFTEDDTNVLLSDVKLDTLSYLCGAGLVMFDSNNVIQEVPGVRNEDD